MYVSRAQSGSPPPLRSACRPCRRRDLPLLRSPLGRRGRGRRRRRRPPWHRPGDREANREDVHHCHRLRERERERDEGGGGRRGWREGGRRALADEKNPAGDGEEKKRTTGKDRSRGRRETVPPRDVPRIPRPCSARCLQRASERACIRARHELTRDCGQKSNRERCSMNKRKGTRG